MAQKKKGQKPKWRQEGGRWVATIPNTVQDQLKAARRADREAQKEAGTLGRTSGCGVHGGDKRERNRRDRHERKSAMRQGRYEE